MKFRHDFNSKTFQAINVVFYFKIKWFIITTGYLVTAKINYYTIFLLPPSL